MLCIWRAVQLSDGRWKDEMCAKEGNHGMFFFFFKLFFILVEKDGITLGGMLLDG